MHQNVNSVNDKFLWETISLLILNFLNIWYHIIWKYDVSYNNYHFTKIKTHFDIEQIVWMILEGQFNKELIEYNVHNIINLHIIDIKIFSTHIEIQKYIIRMKKEWGYMWYNWEKDSIKENDIEIEKDNDK